MIEPDISVHEAKSRVHTMLRFAFDFRFKHK